jgi:hypothetical protein
VNEGMKNVRRDKYLLIFLLLQGKITRAGQVPKMVQHLPSKHEAPSSNPSTTKKNLKSKSKHNLDLPLCILYTKVKYITIKTQKVRLEVWLKW